MRFVKQARVLAAAAFLVVLVQCDREVTAPTSPRTRSVATTAQIPANPTAPIALITNDPQSQVEMTLPVAALQRIVQVAGGPAQITLTDLAPVDYITLPAAERAHIESHGQKLLAAFSIDIKRSGATAAQVAQIIEAFQASNTVTTQFKVKNSSGRRCTPGVVDFFQVFGTNSTRAKSSIFIDDAFPLQNIVGSADVAYEVLHFIFCWECPRVTPSGSSGG